VEEVCEHDVVKRVHLRSKVLLPLSLFFHEIHKGRVDCCGCVLCRILVISGKKKYWNQGEKTQAKYVKLRRVRANTVAVEKQ